MGVGTVVGAAQPDVPFAVRRNLRRAFEIGGKIGDAPQDVIGVEPVSYTPLTLPTNMDGYI